MSERTYLDFLWETATEDAPALEAEIRSILTNET